MSDQRNVAEAGDETARTQPQQQRSSIPSFLFIGFMLFMLTNHSGDEFLARHQYQDAIESLKHQLANYTAWMNGTESNFSLPTRQPILDDITASFVTLGTPLPPETASYYPNITGFIHGDAKCFNITPTSLAGAKDTPWLNSAKELMSGSNLSTIIPRLGYWNWSASDKLALSIAEKPPLKSAGGVDLSKDLTLVHGRIELTDSNTAEDLKFEFEAVHLIPIGSIYGLAEPGGRHVDIRMLPSLVPEQWVNETALIIEPELNARITKLKKMIDSGVVDQDNSGTEEVAKTTCPFTFYGQVEAAPISKFLMEELEGELEHPTGIWSVTPPKLAVRGVLISKECGLLYEVSNTEGLRSRQFFRKVTTYAGSAALAYLVLLVLLSRQIAHSRTPAGISRVSRWTFLVQAIMDSVSFAGHITFAILAEGRPSLSLVAPAFLACILFVHEAQFALLIHQIQLPEDVPSSPRTVPQPGTGDAAASPATTPSPAAPAPAASPNTSIFWALVHHIRTDPQARLWVTMFVLLTLTIRVVLSPTLALIFVAVIYSLLWLPQIIRSARRGRSSALSKEYLFGTTFCRLYFLIYFLGCPKNVLDIDTRQWSFYLALFVFLQMLLVLLQESAGPTFFLPKRLAKVEVYNYHPPMPLPDSEAPEQSLGDCAICMDAILVDPSLRRQESKEGDWDYKGKGGGLLNAVQMGVGTSARKNYSLAPCDHLFHTECLERWLAIKNICPQCRRPLPPL